MEELDEKESGRNFTSKEMLGNMQFETWKDDMVEKELCALNGMVSMLIDGQVPEFPEPIWEAPALDRHRNPMVDQDGAPIMVRTPRYNGGAGATYSAQTSKSRRIRFDAETETRGKRCA